MVKVQPRNLREPVYLPNELLKQIILYVAISEQYQETLYSACLVSRQWYSVAIGKLYDSPYLYGSKFFSFVNSIAPPTVRPGRPGGLGGLVRTLDLSQLIHQSTRSLTAKLIGRTKSHLESFTAPQTSFAVNAFPALTKCSNLRKLDLSLASGVISAYDCLHLMDKLPELEEFSFPKECVGGRRPYDRPKQASKLKTLRLRQMGLETFAFLQRAWSQNPPPIVNLSLTDIHGPQLPIRHARDLVDILSTRLCDLTVSIRIQTDDVMIAWDSLLRTCQRLERLTIPASLIGPRFFSCPPDALSEHPLEVISVTPSRPSECLPRATHLRIDAPYGGYFNNVKAVRLSVAFGHSLAALKSLLRLRAEFRFGLIEYKGKLRNAGSTSNLEDLKQAEQRDAIQVCFV